MATYYVRKTGNNVNAGTSSGSAWATVTKALQTATSGDTVYVGAGVYRETLQITSTTAISAVNIIADVDGKNTGDVGEVRITAYTTDDKTSPSSTSLLDLNSKPYFVFKQFVFVGGSAILISNTGSGLCQNTQFIDCTFIHLNNSYKLANLATTTTDTAPNWLFDRCRFFHQGNSSDCIYLDVPQGSVADLNTNIIIRNCLFVRAGTGAAVNFNPSASGGSGATFNTGGVQFYNNTVIGGATGLNVGSNASTSNTCKAYGNFIVTGTYGLLSNPFFAIIEDYNLIYSPTTTSNVSTGFNSQNTNYSALVHIGQELQQGKLTRPMFMPTADSPLLGFGNDATYTSGADILNRLRPSGGGPTWSSANKATGCYERHDFAIKESTTVDAGTAIKMTGPGDHRIIIPVNAASTTISIKVQRDTNYGAGTKPTLRLEANGEIGVATQAVADTGSASTYNTLTLSAFTPTAKGWVTITLESYAAGNGNVYWDTLTVS